MPIHTDNEAVIRIHFGIANNQTRSFRTDMENGFVCHWLIFGKRFSVLLKLPTLLARLGLQAFNYIILKLFKDIKNILFKETKIN